MPDNGNSGQLPPSPIENDDLWLVNRQEKSYKVNSSMLGSYLINVELPIPCDSTNDCPFGEVCIDGVCGKLPCEPTVDNPDGCPVDYYCYGGYCYPNCDPDGQGGTGCAPGYICTDPGIGNNICLNYPFPCNEDGYGDGCPDGFECYNGYCFLICLPGVKDCPDGMTCVEYPQMGEFVCVPEGGGFPCAEGQCPFGYQCYNGKCWEICDLNATPNGCLPGYSCTDVDGPNPICLPDLPELPVEKFVNDGKLYVEGTNPDGDPAKMVLFTANQYGDSTLKIDGLIIDPDAEKPGGGSCTINGDCNEGFICVDGICVMLPCQHPSNPGGICPPDYECVLGYCYYKCNNGTCPDGYECMTIDGKPICVPGGQLPGGGGCSSNSNCDPGYFCDNGICRPYPCTDDASCSANQVCFGGNCYNLCGLGYPDCPDDHQCVAIGNGITICMPTGGGGNIPGGGSGGNISVEIDFNQVIPAGSRLIFPQASAPDHWVKLTGYNQHALRIVDGSGGGTGGNLNFTSAFDQKAVPLLKHRHSQANQSGTTSTNGAHKHNFTVTISGRSGRASVTGEAQYTPERVIDESLTEFLDGAYELLHENEFITGSAYPLLLHEALEYRSTEGLVTVIQGLADFSDGIITQAQLNTIVDGELTRIEHINPETLGYGIENKVCEDIQCPENMLCIDGICVCEDNHIYDSNTGSCIEDPQSTFSTSYCPPNSTFNGLSCECDDGYTSDATGVCVEVPGGYPVPQCSPAYQGVKCASSSVPPKNCGGSVMFYMGTTCTDGSGGTWYFKNGVSGAQQAMDGMPGVNVTGSPRGRDCIINVSAFPYDINTSPGKQWRIECKHNWLGQKGLTVGQGTTVPIYVCDPCLGVSCGPNSTCNNGKCNCNPGFIDINGKCQSTTVSGTSDSSGSHDHTVTTKGGNTSYSGVDSPKMDFRVKYLDSIVCEKEPYN